MMRSNRVECQIEALENLDITALQKKWIDFYSVPPPRKVRREFLKRAIGYRLREKAYGGLSAATRRELARLAKEMASGKSPLLAPMPSLRPGARLMREWNGVMQQVDVLEDGFVWQEKRFTSLSAVAEAISGTKWSGPRFFGLDTKRGKR